MDPNRKMFAVSVALIVVLSISIFFGLSQLTPDAYTVQARKIFNDALNKIEQIRNVTMPSGISLHVITKQQAVDMWGKPSGTADLTNLYRQEKIYKGLFMMPETDSLYQATSDWTANWAAATTSDHQRNIYDIYILRENFNPFDKEAENTFIHELTHVWQPVLQTPTTYDEDKAHTALIEGDASFMGDYYINMTQAQAKLPAYLLSAPWLDNVYPMANTLWSLSYFPYDHGKTFVTALYNQGGFAVINQAYQQDYTPSSTAQILHPELYFANQTAQPVTTGMPKDDAWTLVKTDRGQNHNTYGEFFIQAMLANWLNQSAAQQAAAGWSADNFTYYENGDDYLFTWNIHWASSVDADEFASAFRAMVAQADASSAEEGWFANGRYITISLDTAQNSTLIACSTVQAATDTASFS